MLGCGPGDEQGSSVGDRWPPRPRRAGYTSFTRRTARLSIRTPYSSMPATTSLRFEIVPMTADDWPVVRQIYLDGLATGQASFETTAPSWEQWDTGHLECCRLVARAPDMPSDRTGDMLGWAALSPVSRRACYRGVAEVSVYVAAQARGHGIGRALLEALVAASEAEGI